MTKQTISEQAEKGIAYGLDHEIGKNWIKKTDALEYVLENYYDEVREAVFEQEAESRQE